MRSLKLGFIVLASAGLLFLGACSNQASESSSNTNVGTTETASTTESKASHGSESKGGQVVESGKYHLELVPQKEANATHI